MLKKAVNSIFIFFILLIMWKFFPQFIIINEIKDLLVVEGLILLCDMFFIVVMVIFLMPINFLMKEETFSTTNIILGALLWNIIKLYFISKCYNGFEIIPSFNTYAILTIIFSIFTISENISCEE